MLQQRFKIISNRQIAPAYYKLIIDAAKIAHLAQPGQFVNILLSNNYEVLLRRPLEPVHSGAAWVPTLRRAPDRARTERCIPPLAFPQIAPA